MRWSQNMPYPAICWVKVISDLYAKSNTRLSLIGTKERYRR